MFTNSRTHKAEKHSKYCSNSDEDEGRDLKRRIPFLVKSRTVEPMMLKSSPALRARFDRVDMLYQSVWTTFMPDRACAKTPFAWEFHSFPSCSFSTVQMGVESIITINSI